jgi:hypothetical protein
MKINFGTGLYLAMGAFMLFILYFFLIAMRDDTPMSSRQAWEDSQTYTRRQGQQQATRAYGTLRVQPLVNGVQVFLPGDSAAAATQLVGELRFQRPDNETMDFTLPLRGGLHHTVVDKRLRTGRWRLKAEWTTGGKTYYDEATFYQP